MRAFLWMRILVVGLLLLPSFSEAAVVKTETLQSAAGATGNGTVMNLGGRYSSLALTVTISATATVTFEGSEDGQTYASLTCVSTANTSGTLVTSATATGSYQCGVSGLATFRARISSFSSGTVTVTGTASDLALGRKGGTGGGGLASTDIDTCAEIAAIVSGETGTCGSLVLSQGPTLVDAVVTGSLNVPNGAAPTTDAFGEVAGDNNAWAASRGAIQFFDGTANTYIIGALASDTPGNGECIKWNTGGTITWETCGSGSMATDTLWDAAGDLAYGTGSNTGGRLAIGTAAQLLQVNSGATAPEWTSAPSGLTSISFGSNPGDAGRIRLSNSTGEGLCWEIATPGTDKCLIVDTSDRLSFNGTINLTGAATGSVVISGVTSGSYTITTADATAQSVTTTVAAQTSGATVLTVPDMAGTNDTYLFAAKAATLTNKTLDCEGTGNVCTIPRRIWFPAAGCNNATAGSIWDLPSSSPAVAACITGTNTQKGVLDFADSADLSAQITYKLPSTWTGTVDANIKWLSTTTSGDVVWQVQTICVADAETDDPAFNTASTVTDTTKGTTNQTNDAAITGVTVTGCAASGLMHVKIRRDSGHASDNMAGTARLIGVELVIREAI